MSCRRAPDCGTLVESTSRLRTRAVTVTVTLARIGIHLSGRPIRLVPLAAGGADHSFSYARRALLSEPRAYFTSYFYFEAPVGLRTEQAEGS